jgi:hypothetical protein
MPLKRCYHRPETFDEDDNAKVRWNTTNERRKDKLFIGSIPL